MHNVINNYGDHIGYFDGVTIFDRTQTLIYRVLGGEIYAPVVMVDLNNHKTSSDALAKIGELRGDIGFSSQEEILFTIERRSKPNSG